MYSIMTCSGWSTSVFGGCSVAWLSLAILFFICLVLRRQCNDGILSGTGFNFIGSLIGGLGTAVILLTITGAARWAFLGGIAGIAVGGFVVGMFLNSGGGME